MHEKEKKYIFKLCVIIWLTEFYTSRETPRLHNNCNKGQNMNPEI